MILDYLNHYDPSGETYAAIVRDLVNKAMNYYRDFILPNKQYRTPTEAERAMLRNIHDQLAAYQGKNEDELQSIPFEVARACKVAPQDLFKMFYEVVLGQERGPRFGTFTRLVGKDKVLALLEAVT